VNNARRLRPAVLRSARRPQPAAPGQPGARQGPDGAPAPGRPAPATSPAGPGSGPAGPPGDRVTAS